MMILFFIIIVILIILIYLEINQNKDFNINNDNLEQDFGNGIVWYPETCDSFNQPCYNQYKYINGYFYPIQ